MIKEFLGSFDRKITVVALEGLLRFYKQKNCRHHPVEKRLLYVPASSLPYHISGYTTRTHEVIRAIEQVGVDICVATRPGYPWDRGDRVESTEETTTLVDTINYKHTRSPSKHRPVVMFALQAAAAIAQIAERDKIGIIQAASNHENALPALLAARMLNIPFQYEMRGLWELTRSSRISGYENSAGFLKGLELEGFVAKNADKILVISEQLGKYARERWNIPAHHFSLLPNCVDPSRFEVISPENIKPMTIGYAGSLISYEGLDTLIEAIHLLSKRGVKVYFNILGDGEARSALEGQVRELKLAEQVCFLGRVSPEEARTTLAKCSVVCIPRKPYKVCEIVPPIKLVEALAMGKPVIAPDLPVFRDEMGGTPPGWFFKAGDSLDLANVVESALTDQAAIHELSGRARKYVEINRCWTDYVSNVV